MSLFQRRLSAKSILDESGLDHEKDSLIDHVDSGEFSPHRVYDFCWFKWAVSKSLTCSFAELPHWLQDNYDIFTGYRRPTFSYLKCIKSLFYLHNESVNIWSHLVGAIMFVLFSVITYFYLLTHPSIKWWDFIAFYCFLIGALTCLSLSAAFHTFCCHSEKVCANWNRCDYVGIVALIVGSIIPLVYYGFYCHNTLKIIYITLLSLFGIATIFVATDLRFRTPPYRWFRTGLFFALGGSAIIPILHAVILYGVNLSFDVIALKWMAITGGFYMLGAVVYGTRIPESLSPGSFDVLGSSHQIFHFFVLAATLTHYYGVIQAMTFWHEQNHECQLDIEKMKPL
ncbi:hypothetical protein Glove_265g19 [Diversispora epigaea]|uniref:Hemolysin-III channel protein Izh2 n=1 Tax=Diversispora epigaea TaxID=1348612 RepID=A0A397I5L2_9GLOM|nr:hypothetical protein Glove_265g19 [Diversispora epigaea]